ADLLTRVYKKGATPWTYWGFRPPPRPANVTRWERSEAIEQALDRVLADSERSVRLDVLRRMLREKVPARTATLGRWLAEDHHAGGVAVVLPGVGERPGSETRPHLGSVFRERKHLTANRLLAVSLFLQQLDAVSEEKLPATAEAVEDGPVLAELLRAIGKRPK